LAPSIFSRNDCVIFFVDKKPANARSAKVAQLTG